MIEKIEEITELKAKVNYIEKQKGDVRDTLADVSKANKELRWMPETSIDEGLGKYISWYLKGRIG